MVQHIPQPDPRDLLPPLLACLPIAFVSPRPPPTLFPLLSPILRQKIQFLSSASDSTDSWLPLLCWDPLEAQNLSSVVENHPFEPHPVSGEIEIEDHEDVQYRRVDEETLQARIGLPDLGLNFIYLWCEENEENGGRGWRLCEIVPTDVNARPNGREWAPSILKAEDQAKEPLLMEGLNQEASTSNPWFSNPAEEVDISEDDYWALYDDTPGKTPAQIHSRSPLANSGAFGNKGLMTTSDADYYAQYAQVQPALDNDDPSERTAETESSTLNGNIVMDAIANPVASRTYSDHLTPPDSSCGTSTTVNRLEDSATVHSYIDITVRQHISASIKHLFRLARGTGMEMEEFARVVRTELDALALVEDDE
ncbi:MAG: hypothetical protein MMC33_001577 [Icmadophila ericetorum]|nr:hypothetical protein [Icmadophila ericetorum]